MANVGEIHLRGTLPWESRAQEFFRKALEVFKTDPEHASYLPQLELCVDLAEKAYMRTLHRAAEKYPETFMAHLEDEARDFATMKILDTLLEWNRANQKTKKRRK